MRYVFEVPLPNFSIFWTTQQNGILILSNFECTSCNNDNLYLYNYIFQFQFLNYVKLV